MEKGFSLGHLAEIPLFYGLTDTQLSKVGESMHLKVFPGGTEILTAQQPGGVVYVVLDGGVKVHLEQPDGSEVVLAILGAGEVVGEMSLSDSLGRSATVATIEESTLLWMDRAVFRANLQEIPALTFNLLNIFDTRLRLVNAHVRLLSKLDVHGRVAGALLSLAREYGKVNPDGDVLIPLRLTQGDLAGLVGASRVRVNQALGYYKRHSHISVDRKHRITIHDPDALARRCR